jgi:hypothetical protein
MKITRTSGLTGAINTRDLDITPAQYTQYLSGTLAQLAFPHLSADDREFLITGITPEEWAEFVAAVEETE